MRYPSAILALALTAACGKTQATVEPLQHVLRNGVGVEIGRVSIRERPPLIQFRIQVAGLPPGLHGMHLHEVGRCEGPTFESAGGHLNPVKAMHHGHKNPQGPHLGDLGNLRVTQDGRGDLTVEVGGTEARMGIRTFLGLGDNGISLLIHADRDDETTDPSGNSGARIGCAELR
jgi:Cu-Zn family superoxide dismutase